MKLLHIAACLLLCMSSFNVMLQADNTPAVSDQRVYLYVYQGCPWCNRVIQFLQDNKWSQNVVIVNASMPKHLAELKQINNNNTQCPCLVDETVESGPLVMLESADIIRYLQQKFSQQ